jgi:transposase
MALKVRELTAEEREAVRRLAHSRTAPAREVERAKMIWLLLQGERVPAVAQQLGRSEPRVRHWVKQFNGQGLAGLQDQPRPGRPPTYPPEQVAEVIATALTAPQQLGQPFGCWSLDRLQAYLNEELEIGIKRSRIDEILLAEGLRWRTQETWFGERASLQTSDGAPRKVDPAFAEKRGRSSGFTRTRPQGV